MAIDLQIHVSNSILHLGLKLFNKPVTWDPILDFRNKFFPKFRSIIRCNQTAYPVIVHFPTDDLKAAYLLGRSNKNELTPELLHRQGWASDRVMAVLNALVTRRLCVLKKNKATGQAIVKVREEEVAAGVRQLSNDDYAVFKAIEDAGNVGIWTQDIARNAQLQSHVVQRAVKALCEQKKLIKPLKSIHQRNRKIYILAHLEPAKEVVGGTFYDNGEFDEGLVERLRSQIMHILRNGSQASLKDLSNYIKSSGFGRDLSDDDLKLVLTTLQLEQEVHSTMNPGTGETVYLWKRWSSLDLYGDTPCGTCPVFDECLQTTAAAPVCPATCRYYNYWLGYEPPPSLKAATDIDS